MSQNSTQARIVLGANDESTADSSPRTPRSPPTPRSPETPDIHAEDFSAEIIVRVRDQHTFDAVRYHLERVREFSTFPTEVVVLDPETPMRRVIRFATGCGHVRMRGDPVVQYTVFDDHVRLSSASKRFLYDFVYEALESYDIVKKFSSDRV